MSLPPVLQIVAWLVCLCWLYKVAEAAIGLPRIANLLLPEYDRSPKGEPSLTVIVPARNEAADIGDCLASLLGQDYPGLQIVAVDDRSTDQTGVIMDAVAARYPERLRVLHIQQLPEDWLGKTHAMALAASEVSTDWLLFTDADVLFRSDSLRRSLAYAVAAGADHQVTMPTTIIKRWDEAALLGFFQIFGMWATRPWRVADPKAKRDAIGIGAFNLVRREAYEQVGGFEALRMEVIEDLGLARRIKRAGLVQRIAFGEGLVGIHWASGAMGLVEVMTKNIFSAFRFSILLALIGCGWLGVFCVAPVLGLLYGPTRIPAALTLLAVWFAYRLYGRFSGISSWQAALSPFAALLLIYTLLRSVVVTLWQGGIVWRGTFYPLATLRKHMRSLRNSAR
jgi:glycosyltransferase involved in cell wall biosynthesis